MESRRNVLLVTDDLPLRGTMTASLRGMGFDVVIAVDYYEAVEYLGSSSPSLVCVDLNLPRESGYHVCEFLRRDARLKDVPILLMSDHGTPQEMADAEEAGANTFVKKPFGNDLLERCVTAMLERRAPSLPSIRQLRPSDHPPSR